MSFYSLDHKLEVLEPLAANYLGPHKLLSLTPLLVGSIFCGVTWGVLGLQFVKYLARGSKSQSAYSSMLAVYLMVASTAYLAMLTMFISYFFAYRFGQYSAAFDVTYSSWLFLIATVFVHVPCQSLYAQNAYTLSGQNKVLGIVFVALIFGTVGVGAALKAILPRILVDWNWIQGFLLKLWIAMTAATDLALSVAVAFLQLRGKSKRYSEASALRKVRLLIVDAQLPATIVSVGLLVLIMVDSYSPMTTLWLGFPLVYPINVMSTLNARRALREDIEAEVSGDRRESDVTVMGEKTEIPPPAHRPSFLLSPFPTIAIRRASTELRRASTKIGQYTGPLLVPAISGVRRASAFLGALPPLTKKSEKRRGFPFKNRAQDPRSPTDIHPASLAYPLQADAAPMGQSARCFERSHSLAPLDTETGQSIALGQQANTGFFNSPPGHPELSDPFANTPRSRSPSPNPTIEEALEAHEIFEMPSTPEVLSPKSSHSPMMADPPSFEAGPEWK